MCCRHLIKISSQAKVVFTKQQDSPQFITRSSILQDIQTSRFLALKAMHPLTEAF